MILRVLMLVRVSQTIGKRKENYELEVLSIEVSYWLAWLGMSVSASQSLLGVCAYKAPGVAWVNLPRGHITTVNK